MPSPLDDQKNDLKAPASQELVDLMHQLGNLSGEKLKPLFRKKMDIANKSSNSFDPVTEADRGAEEVIRQHLEKAAPNHGIIGEEYDDKQATPVNGDLLQWVIDPIDGTRSFISGVPVWGTLIGLLKNGSPHIGLMNQPFTKERYWSDGKNSFLSTPEGEETLQTRTGTDLENAILFTTAPDMFKTDHQQNSFNAIQEKAKLTRFGTDCYAYCLLAAGHIDLVVEVGLKTFDIAALIPIIENAGGVITNWDGSPATQGGQVIAAGSPELHNQTIKLLS